MMKSVNSNTYIIETHRAKEDRRSFESPTKIPMIDIKGKIIQKDRRHIPDRRIGNIEVTEYNYSFFEQLLKIK
ncbi:MAG: hypothetical protein ACR2PU_02860 [Gammaproteobacteria bacterium]